MKPGPTKHCDLVFPLPGMNIQKTLPGQTMYSDEAALVSARGVRRWKTVYLRVIKEEYIQDSSSPVGRPGEFLYLIDNLLHLPLKKNWQPAAPEL